MTTRGQARRQRAQDRPILSDLPRCRVARAMHCWFMALSLVVLVPFLICLATGAWHLDGQAVWPTAALLLLAHQAYLVRCSVIADPRLPAVIVRNRLCTWAIPWEEIVDTDLRPSHMKQRYSSRPTFQSVLLVLDGGAAGQLRRPALLRPDAAGRGDVPGDPRPPDRGGGRPGP